MSSTALEELALEIAQFGPVEGPTEIGTLRNMTDLSAIAIPGCSGATAIQWRRSEPHLYAASHPELADILELQIAQQAGPSFDAIRTGSVQSCADTLVEVRWPLLIHAMRDRGIRCFSTSVHVRDDLALTLTVYGVLPHALEGGRSATAALLTGQASTAFANTRRFDQASRMALQFQEALASQAVVEQAKGILMNALGCDSDQAFAELRKISQSSHAKVTAVARRIVSQERS